MSFNRNIKSAILKLFDFDRINVLLEGFNKSTGFVTAILDLEGNVLSQSGWRPICTEFHRVNPDTAHRCRISDTELANKMQKGEKYHFYRCLNGLVDVAVPIVINGEHIANLFSGQFLFEEPDVQFFKEQARQFGFNEEVYLNRLKEVPVISSEKVQPAMSFLLSMTEMIVELTMQRMQLIDLNNALTLNHNQLKIQNEELIRAKDSIETSQNILEIYVEHSPAAIAMFDHEMRYLVVSKRFLKDYRITDENIIGKSHYEVFPEIPDHWKKTHQRGLNGETIIESKDAFQRPDGSIDWIRWEIRPWYERGDKIGGIILLSEVITAQVKAEEALLERDRLMSEMGRIAKVGAWEFDTSTMKGSWTEEVALIHDLDPTLESTVEVGLKYYLPESKAKIQEAIEAAIKLGKPYDLELEMITNLGTHKWVRTIGVPVFEGGKVVKVRGSFQDITEKTVAVTQLQESRTILQAVLNSIPVRVFWKDKNLHYLGCNISFARDAGFASPHLLTGKSDYEMGWAEQADLYRADDQNVIETGESRLFFEEPQTTPQGEKIHLLTSKVPLRDSKGKILGVLGTYLDISDRKRAQEEIQRLNAELEERVQKRTTLLEATNHELESFSYSVSHDLRAPLRAIMGFITILQEDYADRFDEEGKRYLELVIISAQKMNLLIDDLLRLSRISKQGLSRSKVSMTELFEKTYTDLTQGDPTKKFQFHIKKLPTEEIYRSLMEIAVSNLLSNAIKFSSKRSDPFIEVGYIKENGGIYYIKDNGVGFEMSYVHKLFDVFQRLHGAQEFDGTGIGLAIVQRIIFKHGGKIWAESTPNHGATFYFTVA